MSREEREPLVQQNSNYSHRGSYEELPASENEITFEVPNQPSKWKKAIGMAFAFTSAILYAALSFSVKNWKLNPTDILVLRSVIQTIGVGVYILGKADSFFPSPSELYSPWAISLSLLLYSLCVGWANLGSLTSIRMIPLGDAITLIFMSPMFTAILARIFRGKEIKGFKIFFIISILLGTILIVQPPFLFGQLAPGGNSILHDYWYFIGVFLGLSVALSVSIIYNLMGGPLNDMRLNVLFLYVGITSFIIAIVSSQFDEQSKILSRRIVEISGIEWLSLFAVVLGGISGFYVNNKASQMADTVIVAMIKCIEIPIGYIIQSWAMNQVPNALGGVGAGLVLVSVAIIPCESLILRAIPDAFRLKKYL